MFLIKKIISRKSLFFLIVAAQCHGLLSMNLKMLGTIYTNFVLPKAKYSNIKFPVPVSNYLNKTENTFLDLSKKPSIDNSNNSTNSNLKKSLNQSNKPTPSKKS